MAEREYVRFCSSLAHALTLLRSLLVLNVDGAEILSRCDWIG